MIEAVIFDMDGVLADTEYYYENRRKNFLLENGIPIPEGNFIGSNEKAIWEAIVPNDPVRRQEMLMAYREYRKVRPTPLRQAYRPAGRAADECAAQPGAEGGGGVLQRSAGYHEDAHGGRSESNGGFCFQRRGLCRP